MTAKECIKGRRSIRQFTDQPVSRELLADIVETASFVPSWKHTQIVRYIAVEGELKSKIAKCTSKYPHNGEIIENAPILIAVTFIKGAAALKETVLSLLTAKAHGRCLTPVWQAKLFALQLMSRVLAALSWVSLTAPKSRRF